MEDNEKTLLIVVTLIIIAIGIGSNILTPEGTPEIPGLSNVFYAVIAGVVIGLLGYTQKTDLPDWETAKFFVTIVLSGIAGYIAYTQNLSWQDAYTWLGVIGFDVLIERIVKMCVRRLSS